jgi:hypothetical protein
MSVSNNLSIGNIVNFNGTVLTVKEKVGYGTSGDVYSFKKVSNVLKVMKKETKPSTLRKEIEVNEFMGLTESKELYKLEASVKSVNSFKLTPVPYENDKTVANLCFFMKNLDKNSDSCKGISEIRCSEIEFLCFILLDVLRLLDYIGKNPKEKGILLDIKKENIRYDSECVPYLIDLDLKTQDVSYSPLALCSLMKEIYDFDRGNKKNMGYTQYTQLYERIILYCVALMFIDIYILDRQIYSTDEEVEDPDSGENVTIIVPITSRYILYQMNSNVFPGKEELWQLNKYIKDNKVPELNEIVKRMIGNGLYNEIKPYTPRKNHVLKEVVKDLGENTINQLENFYKGGDIPLDIPSGIKRDSVQSILVELYQLLSVVEKEKFDGLLGSYISDDAGTAKYKRLVELKSNLSRKRPGEEYGPVGTHKTKGGVGGKAGNDGGSRKRKQKSKKKSKSTRKKKSLKRKKKSEKKNKSTRKKKSKKRKPKV